MMKRVLVLAALAAASFGAGSIVSAERAEAARALGQVQVGAYVNCAVTNYSGYVAWAGGVQYEYTCTNPWTGATAYYAPYVTCGANCSVAPGATQVFSGPSTANCNVTGARCWVDYTY